MTHPVSACRVSAAEIRVNAALADDFDPRRDLPAFIRFACDRENYADAAMVLLSAIFPPGVPGRKNIVKNLREPTLDGDIRVRRIATAFRLIPWQTHFRSIFFGIEDLVRATRAKRKSARAWVALACLGYTRGPGGRPIEFDLETSPWPTRPKERAGLVLWLITRRAFALQCERTS